MNGRNRRRSRVFDLAHGAILFAPVDSLSFGESPFQVAGIGVEGVYDVLRATVIPGAVFQPFLQPPQPIGHVSVPDGLKRTPDGAARNR